MATSMDTRIDPLADFKLEDDVDASNGHDVEEGEEAEQSWTPFVSHIELTSLNQTDASTVVGKGCQVSSRAGIGIEHEECQDDHQLFDAEVSLRLLSHASIPYLRSASGRARSGRVPPDPSNQTIEQCSITSSRTYSRHSTYLNGLAPNGS